jgi:predicted nucleic acid-binding protein
MIYAFDTNTVIHLMIGTESVRRNRNNARDNGSTFFVPPFVQYEIDRGLLIKPNAKNERAYAQLLENCELRVMTADTWKKAAEIYADLYTKRFTVRDSDIVIAAFCILNNCTLVTNNTKDFINMDGLKIVDWVM